MISWSNLLIVGVFLALLAWLGVRRLGLGSPFSAPIRIRARPALLTPAEQRFHAALEAALPQVDSGRELRLSCQVRLADLMTLQASRGLPGWRAAFAPIARMSVDFVLLDRRSFEVLCVIELQDRTHRELAERRERDRFLRKVLAEAGLPLLEVRAARTYDSFGLARQLQTKLGEAAVARERAVT